MREPKPHLLILLRPPHWLFVAGVWVGIHRDPQTLVDTLRAMRRQVDISTEVGAGGCCLVLARACGCWCAALRWEWTERRRQLPSLP